jgi:uroporphyrinogen-III synthase
MRVLVTRPQPDADRLAEKLRALGHKPFVAPLMRVEPSGEKPPQGIENAVLLFTSANGVRAAAEAGVHPACGIYAVGSATAEAARAAGFSVAGMAAGNVASLADRVAARQHTDDSFVHVAGTELAGDLQGLLEARGFKPLRWRAYMAVAAEMLPHPARVFFQGSPGAVLLYSPRTARVLVRLTKEAGLAGSASAHAALCLSPAVADAAQALDWRRVVSAAEPHQRALLDLLAAPL